MSPLSISSTNLLRVQFYLSLGDAVLQDMIDRAAELEDGMD
jgi:hypothetical protein